MVIQSKWLLNQYLCLISLVTHGPFSCQGSVLRWSLLPKVNFLKPTNKRDLFLFWALIANTPFLWNYQYHILVLISHLSCMWWIHHTTLCSFRSKPMFYLFSLLTLIIFIVPYRPHSVYLSGWCIAGVLKYWLNEYMNEWTISDTCIPVSGILLLK